MSIDRENYYDISSGGQEAHSFTELLFVLCDDLVQAKTSAIEPGRVCTHVIEQNTTKSLSYLLVPWQEICIPVTKFIF